MSRFIHKYWLLDFNAFIDTQLTKSKAKLQLILHLYKGKCKLFDIQFQPHLIKPVIFLVLNSFLRTFPYPSFNPLHYHCHLKCYLSLILVNQLTQYVLLPQYVDFSHQILLRLQHYFHKVIGLIHVIEPQIHSFMTHLIYKLHIQI